MQPLKIGIDRLELVTSVGIYAGEKQEKQTIFVSAELWFTGMQIEIDDMKQSVDYDMLSDTIRGVAAERHYELIENLALHIGRGLKAAANAERVSVRIDKPLAANKNRAASIYVVVET
ncbi:MAG: dihydroneopterin aldolase [Spirochaetes bacterium]|nr:dihydroneopterin aldolase [Spirochaetota bacterium]